MDAKTLCLAVLIRGEASGYEIKKALEEPPLGHFQDTGFGSIYPALARLTEEGLVRGTEMAQEGRPDKKVHQITEAGRRALVASLMEPPAPDRFRSDFMFMLYLGDLIPGEHLAAMVERRIAHYEERIAAMEDCARHLETAPAGRRLTHGLGLALYRAAAAYLKENRALVAAAGAGGAPGLAAE